MLNKQIIYRGKKYILLYEYDSGFCEIKEDDDENRKIELVHKSQLTV